MENNCLIREDACPGLLNLYPIRILTVRSRALKLARVRLSIKRQLPLTFHIKRSLSYVLVSCTTISVYVNLSKNVLYKRAHQRSATSRRGGFTSFAGAKVRFFREPAKHFEVFFKKRCIFAIHTLYIIYAREGKGRKKAVTRTKGDCRLCCRKGIFLLVPSD